MLINGCSLDGVYIFFLSNHIIVIGMTECLFFIEMAQETEASAEKNEKKLSWLSSQPENGHADVFLYSNATRIWHDAI